MGKKLLKGVGIVQLPDYSVQPHLDSGQLIELLTQHQQFDDGIWVVYPENRHLLPKVRFLLDRLIQGMGATRTSDPFAIRLDMQR